MFDIATRPVPVSLGATGIVAPFDWRITQPVRGEAYGYTEFNTPDRVPVNVAVVLDTYAVALEDSLQTAVILSLFCDARASDDDPLPLNVTKRRGWVGDEFMGDTFDDAPDHWGSRLWLYYSGKATGDVLEGARFAAQEALDWMVRDGVASQVVVTTQWYTQPDGNARLAVRPQIFQPGKAAPVYDVLWGTTISRGAA